MSVPKSSARIALKKCPVCRSTDVTTRCVGDRHYRYQCNTCMQWFEFNAKSQLQADYMWNDMFAR